MAIWKEQTPPKKEANPLVADSFARKEEFAMPDRVASSEPTPRSGVRDGRESVIGSELTIEGKIEGAGHVRIAGRFKGDVNVDGNLVIEPGAKVNGGVKAHAVTIGGQVDGNIADAGRVELLGTGVLIGDLKAGALTVAEGARMRGRVEFGWGQGDGGRSAGSIAGDAGVREPEGEPITNGAL